MNEKTKISRQAIKENRRIKLLSFLHSKTAVIGFLITAVMILLALLAPVLAPEGPYVNDAANRLKAPSALYIMGTDKLGRSVWVRILYGIRISLIVGSVTTIVSMVLGTIRYPGGVFSGDGYHCHENLRKSGSHSTDFDGHRPDVRIFQRYEERYYCHVHCVYTGNCQSGEGIHTVGQRDDLY